jgi:hypothetical protein
MKPSDPIFTHKGWFWLCPIFIAPDVEGCPVEARVWWLEPLFSISELFERARIFASGAMLTDYEPSFMFIITGRIQ